MSPVRTRALIMVISRTDTIELTVEEFDPEIVGVILSQDILGPIVTKCEELTPRTSFRYRIVDSPMEIGHRGVVETEERDRGLGSYTLARGPR